MAFLGNYGALSLQREQANPGVLRSADLNTLTSSVLFVDPAYMTGDQVTLTLTGGLPISGAGASANYWIHKDKLDRISFYTVPENAVNGVGRLGFIGNSWADITIAQTQPPMKFVADVREWSLNLDVAAIDTTPIGVRFGENICDLVTGTGSFQFLVGLGNDTTIMTSLELLNLLFLTGPGGKATAQFWLNVDISSDGCDGLLPSSLYYEANILIVSSSVQIKPDEIVEGVLRFATTEDVALRVAAPVLP
jgi:hypothetical protein